MSWFLGSMCLSPSAPDWKTPVRQRLSAIRNHYAERVDWADSESDGLLLLKGSVRAYPDIGMTVRAEGVCTQAGEALLPATLAAPSNHRRSEETASLLDAYQRGNHSELLAQSRGTFACVAYDSAQRRLLLATDKLGVRPVYHCREGDIVYFGTSLRDLLGILGHQPEVDRQGFAELLAFNYAFDGRTGLEGIGVLRPGTMLDISSEQATELCYFDLRDEARSKVEPCVEIDEVFRHLVDAVKIRANGAGEVASFLSGGLDSRTLCAILRRLEIVVHTANFASPTSQDTYCSELASQALGTHHRRIDLSREAADDAYSKGSVRPWIREMESLGTVPEPRMIWSGDGGSVGLGCVYMSEESCALAESGQLTEAMSRAQPSIAYLKDLKAVARQFVQQAILEARHQEAETLRDIEGCKALHLFLIRNDQRCHLYRHYDHILEGGVDLQVPLYDAALVSAIVRQQTRGYLLHRAYMQLLERFLPETLEAPFQSYPGHVPSVIACPAELTYQWGRHDDAIFARKRRRDNLRLYKSALCSYRKISDLVSLPVLVAGFCRQLVSNHDYGYPVRGAALLIGLRSGKAPG